MSWLFSKALMDASENSRSSQALVEASLGDSCSGGEPFAQLNVMPTPHKFWRNDKTIEPSNLSRFGLTCRLLPEHLGADVLTWCREASRAKTSASPARAQASTESDPECGGTWRGWLARFDPASSSWRTAQQSFIEDSGECLETFPRWGMTRDGLLWERPTLAPHTNANASGWWPTPTANQFECKDMEAMLARRERAKVKLWPTPTVSGNYNRKGASPTSGDGLATAVFKCATPTARDWRSGKASEASEATMMRNSRPLSEQIGGSLNPTWVEWLMGWPLGWTDLEPSATDKYRCAQQLHSECSQHLSIEETA